jgi:hypothetical protein
MSQRRTLVSERQRHSEENPRIQKVSTRARRRPLASYNESAYTLRRALSNPLRRTPGPKVSLTKGARAGSKRRGDWLGRRR